jgi:hypothetical protein
MQRPAQLAGPSVSAHGMAIAELVSRKEWPGVLTDDDVARTVNDPQGAPRPTENNPGTS